MAGVRESLLIIRVLPQSGGANFYLEPDIWRLINRLVYNIDSGGQKRLLFSSMFFMILWRYNP